MKAKQFESHSVLMKANKRWRHWTVLILFVFCLGFNIVESCLFEGAFTNLLFYNVSQVLKGSNDFKAMAESIELTGDDVIEVDKTSKFRLTFSPDNSMDSYGITYEFDTDISFSYTGGRVMKLTPYEEGEIHIKAYLKDYKYICCEKTVTCVYGAPTSISVTNYGGTTLTAGATGYVVVTNNSYKYDVSKINFVSTDPEVATVDEEGYVHALKAGKTSIYAESIYDTSVVSKEITYTVKDGTYYAPESIESDPIIAYAKKAPSVKPVFNGGESCSEKQYKLESLDGDFTVRRNMYAYCDEVTDPLRIRISSVADPSVYCDTTIQFLEVRATAITSTETSYDLEYDVPHKVATQLVSEFEGYSVTYTDLEYEIISGEGATLTNGYLESQGLVDSQITVRVTLVRDPSIYLDVTYNVSVDEQGIADAQGSFLQKFLGHFCIFFLTGILGMLSYYFYLYDDKKKIRSAVWFVIMIGIGLFVSFIPEYIQVFFSRGESLTDVEINISGYMAGFALALIILLIIYLIKIHNKKKADTVLYIANE